MTPYTEADELEELFERLAVAHRTDDRSFIDMVVARIAALTPPAAPATAVQAALWYADNGLRVFPLTPGAKTPLRGSHGCKDATTDTARVRAWWDTTPDANVGIATGCLVDVIDIDGPEGVKSWATMTGLPPIVGRVSTPRPGGNHLYVAAVPGRGNRAGIAPHVDYRGTGGYVVAPPSVITTGPNPGTYAWHRPLDLTQLAAVDADREDAA